MQFQIQAQSNRIKNLSHLQPQGLQSQITEVQKVNLDPGAAEIKGWVVTSLQCNFKTTLWS